MKDLIIKNISVVNQGGHLSNKVYIHRGCRQGDPISSYIFILCVEILACRIRQNSLIKGININNQDIKLSQFADDTTLILDGTESSLNSSLNEISFYGTLSGLKINIDKTHVIWIGSKKYSKNTMCSNYKLKWGGSTFNMLGIEYDVNLQNITRLNYDKKLVKIKALVQNWSKRDLTPLGRNTVFKSLIISQLNHLISSIPNPSDSFIKELISIMFTFIWNGPTDKIKRNVCIQKYQHGGLKVLDIQSYITSLKSTWIRKYLKGNGRWKILFEKTINVNYLINFGSDYIKVCSNSITNLFWKDTLHCWKEITDIEQKNLKNINILTEPLWYNNKFKIDGKSFFYKKLYDKGIYCLGHLIGENSMLMDYQTFTTYINIQFNFIQYLGMVKVIQEFITNNNTVILNKITFPILPNTVSFFYKHSKGAKDMYNILISNKLTTPTGKVKWNNTFNLEDKNWNTIFKLPFIATKDTKIRWFQTRINHNIIGTNSLLHKIDPTQSDKCSFCGTHIETIEHIFWYCEKTQNLLIEFENKLGILNINLSYNKASFLFGMYLNSKIDIGKNLILLWLKYYIYKSKQQKASLNLSSALTHLKTYYELTKTSYIIENSVHKFDIIWKQFSNLFQ